MAMPMEQYDDEVGMSPSKLASRAISSIKSAANGMNNEVDSSAAPQSGNVADAYPKMDLPAPGCKPDKLFDTNYLCLYLCSLTTFALIWQTFHDIGLSTLLTFAVLVQVMALSALLMAIHVRRSVAGLSLKSILMQGVSFFLRLCSTSWLKGYIPVDSTGDWLYQFADFCALCLCLQLAYLVSVTYRRSYQAEQDSFAAPQVVVFCFLLAVLVHPDLNNRPFFDAIWTASLYVDVVSTLPQLWMIGKIGGKVDALSAHYVFLIAVSRFVDMIFWYYGFEELAPENGGFNLAGWVVLGAHLVHLLLMWDFIFCYVRSTFLKGEIGNKTLDFSEMMGVMDQV